MILALLLLGGLLAEPSILAAQDSESNDDAPAAINVRPGEQLPNFVQLTPDGGSTYWDPDQVGDFHLIDQAGNVVTRETLLGKPWVVNFIFTRCNFECRETSKRIMDLNDQLRSVDMHFVTITVDPEYDTPELMAEYASIWGADPDRWLFLTGQPEEVWRLIREGFKVPAWKNVGTDIAPGREFAHSNHLLHIGPEGKILGRYLSFDEGELSTLKRVLRGQIETPEEFRPASVAQKEAFEGLKSAAREREKETDRQASKRDDLPVSPQGPVDPLLMLPPWARKLPTTNAMLNALSLLLLINGFLAIKRKHVHLHRNLMLSAFAVSAMFLVTYLAYHAILHQYTGLRGMPYAGPPAFKVIYYPILVSHIVLAAIVPALAMVTIGLALRGMWNLHRRVAWVTFPLWLYVCATGIIVYLMLYVM